MASIEATSGQLRLFVLTGAQICDPRVVRQHTYRQKQTFTFDAPQRLVFGGKCSVAI
jgi:hypothetical protein